MWFAFGLFFVLALIFNAAGRAAKGGLGILFGTLAFIWGVIAALWLFLIMCAAVFF